MNKIIMVILETCDLTYLVEIMVDYTKRFQEILNKPIQKALESEDKTQAYLLLKEKTHIFLVFEVMFRRLKSETIKTTVHKRLYGPDS